MKKVIIGGMLLGSLLLSACGNTETSSDQNNSSTGKTTESSTVVKPETSTTKSQTEASTSEAASNVSFKDGVATLEDIDVKITKHAVIQPGEAGNEYGDKPVIAFWYDTTNKTGKEIDPTSAWMVVFKAVQDNDPNMENELQVAGLPDQQYLNTQTNKIKKGGTVSNAVAYTLTDTTTPVTLIAKQGLMGEELGRQDYAVQ